MKWNATRADIVQRLAAGHSNNRISRELRCDKTRVARIRRELDLGEFVPTTHTRTLEEKWALFTVPTDDGHLLWTGRRTKTSGTPVFSYRERTYTARKIAFRIRTGRDPEGHALAECGTNDCVLPEHVDDGTIRTRDRAALAALTGRTPRRTTCHRGHDYATHRRYLPDGRSYCAACPALAKGKTT